jgi:hypothetical protein
VRTAREHGAAVTRGSSAARHGLASVRRTAQFCGEPLSCFSQAALASFLDMPELLARSCLTHAFICVFLSPALLALFAPLLGLAS